MQDLNALRDQLRGTLITPEDDAYDDARRVYNAMHDKRPRAIIRAVDEADVIAAVRFAMENDSILAVRGGGHSVPGYGTCDDGLVLDLGQISYVRVDPDGRTARAGGGCILGDLDHATAAFGLATPAGFNSTTGIGGLTLGGGIGAYLSRKHGLTCDNLVSADVVTAEGKRVTASAHQNEDLFWALRGGGGNFGVVTSFEYRLHPLEGFVAGPVFFELEAAPEVMRTFRDYTATAPRELSAFFGFQIAPPLPFIPEDRHGQTLCVLVLSWCGPEEKADEMLRPLRTAGPVVAEQVGPVPYPAMQSAFDALLPTGLQHYWKSDFVTDLSDDAIAAHMEHGPKVPYVSSTMHLYLVDGAVHDVKAGETAFPVRDARFAMNVVGIWPERKDNDKNIAWVRDYYEALHPYSGYEGGYTNFMSLDDTERVQKNYSANYERLRQVKSRWDPDNVFRLNQNIEPSR